MQMDPTLEKLSANLLFSLEKTFEAIPLSNLSLEAITLKLAEEVIGAARIDAAGKPYAPDQFTLTVHPDNLKGSNSWSDETQAKLSFDLEHAIRSAHIRLALRPHITLASDPTLGLDDVRVIAWHSTNPLGMQESIEVAEGDTDRPPLGAFIIVDGKRHFKLSSPRITIGRRLDNDLVLDDQHVSRLHAHLLAKHGHYLLEDLESTAGTRVNGRRVMEHYLKPGDVITIATSELIYGEDRGGPPDVTPPYRPQPEVDRDFETPLDLKTIKLTSLEDEEK
jgi:hypothetical protein